MPADDFFNDIDFVSIVNTIKGIMTSDGSMSVLLDYERVLDDADVYAFKNWKLGELVQGPETGRYSVSCTFMWPYKLMPDPRACKRLMTLGCECYYGIKTLEVPIEVKDYDDFVQGTMFPKMIKRKVWLVKIDIPLELMDDIKEGSIDLADKTVDLSEIDDAYDDDLDKEDAKQKDQLPAANLGLGPMPPGPAGPGPAPGGPLPGL
jgi:hypothetical protein